MKTHAAHRQHRQGSIFVSIGSRVMSPDYLQLALVRALSECTTCTVFLLDAEEHKNLTELSDMTEEAALEDVRDYTTELIAYAEQHWPRHLVTVYTLSKWRGSATYSLAKVALQKEFDTNPSFKHHVLSQTYSNLRPVFKRKGILRWRNSEVVERLSAYLLSELALKLTVACDGIADTEYGPALKEMEISTSIAENKYPALADFTAKSLRYVPVPPELLLRGISYRYPGGHFALSNVTLRIPPGTRYGIIGSNGSGKTTLLQIIGGHIPHDEGVVEWGGMDISSFPPGKRPTATVFQDCALFPHMTILSNVAFGVRHKRGRSASRSRAIAQDWLGKIGVDATLMRSKPAQLSGGYQQRAAIARALAIRPSILLLDEPTAALDAAHREDLIAILRSAVRTGWVTSLIMVSHDQDFVLAVCDRIAVLNEGRVLYEGLATEALEMPPTARTASLLGDYNIIEGTITDDDMFRSLEGEVAWKSSGHPDPDSNRAAIVFRPEKVLVSDTLVGEGLRLRVTIVDIHRRSDAWLLVLTSEFGLSLRLSLPLNSLSDKEIGQSLDVLIADADVHVVKNDLHSGYEVNDESRKQNGGPVQLEHLPS